MAGYNSRFLYDQCTFDQNLKTSTEPCRYQLLNDKFENNNMEIGKDPCIKNNVQFGCKPCDYNNIANIDAKWKTIGLRTDIESELWVLNRPNSRCVEYKYSKCNGNSKCNNNKCDNNKCKNYIILNTRICDRNIVPTNNKMPLTSGF